MGAGWVGTDGQVPVLDGHTHTHERTDFAFVEDEGVWQSELRSPLSRISHEHLLYSLSTHFVCTNIEAIVAEVVGTNGHV